MRKRMRVPFSCSSSNHWNAQLLQPRLELRQRRDADLDAVLLLLRLGGERALAGHADALYARPRPAGPAGRDEMVHLAQERLAARERRRVDRLDEHALAER